MTSSTSRPVQRQKVFVVGFNKTGTSSIHALFEQLGLRSLHHPSWSRDPRAPELDTFDCFSDGTPADVRPFDTRFPGARFILQVRELDRWVYSRLAHIQRERDQGTLPAERSPYWADDPRGVRAWLRRRGRHHLNVLHYFARRPGDLLVVNFVRDPDAAARVARFLGFDAEPDRPYRNVNPSRVVPPEHRDLFHHSCEQLGIPEDERGYDIYCPSQLRGGTVLAMPPDTGVFSGHVPVADPDGVQVQPDEARRVHQSAGGVRSPRLDH